MILHVDMDAFYASVEERENPALKGHPLIVGGSASGRGVVSAANYAARKFGIHSAMPVAQALRLCPTVHRVKTRMGLYAEVSQQIRSIFYDYTPEIEPLSLDEAFLNVGGTQRLFGSAIEIGRQIQQRIGTELQLAASVGIASNKFLAKLASDLEKPSGFTVIAPEQVQAVLDPLPLSHMWGIGSVTEKKFHRRGVRTFGQLRQLGCEQSKALFGNHGEHFWRLSQGWDSRQVNSERRAKSVSHETTFGRDIEDREVLAAWLLQLTEQVAQRLRLSGKRGKTIHLKVRYGDFHTITRARTLERHSYATRELWTAASSLLENGLPNRRLQIRLLGMGVSNLVTARPQQLRLFDDCEPGQEASARSAHDEQLDRATDAIRQSFGRDAIRRGSTLGHTDRRPGQDQGR